MDVQLNSILISIVSLGGTVATPTIIPAPILNTNKNTFIIIGTVLGGTAVIIILISLGVLICCCVFYKIKTKRNIKQANDFQLFKLK